MAKIKQVKLTLGLDPKRPYQETTVAINYNATDRKTETFRRPVPPDDERFFINLPKTVADALGVDKAKAGDQEAVVARFMEFIEQYKCLEVKVNQLILYKIEVEPKPGEKKSAFASGFRKVSVWAGAYEETVATAGDGGKRYSYARVESQINYAELDEKDWYNHTGRGTDRFNQQVPRTEQNVAFFLWIKNNMDNLIERLHELVDPERMIETINEGRLLPLGAGEELKAKVGE